MNTQKVCLVYTDSNGDLQRSRFHKPTSKMVLKRKQEILANAGYKPELMTRNVWERKMGPINNPASAVLPNRDLRFVEKTMEMKQWQHQHERQNGKPLAY